jgi:hypothetical protein
VPSDINDTNDEDKDTIDTTTSPFPLPTELEAKLTEESEPGMERDGRDVLALLCVKFNKSTLTNVTDILTSGVMICFEVYSWVGDPPAVALPTALVTNNDTNLVVSCFKAANR